MIFDVILILIFVLLILVNVKRGAAKALANIIINIVSYFLATLAGKALAGVLYENLVKPAVETGVTNAVNGVSSEAAQSVTDALPSWITQMLNLSNDSLTELFSGPISKVETPIANAVNDAVQPVASSVLTFFTTLILFIIFALLLRLVIMKPLNALFRFSLLNVANKVLGGVIGFVDSFLLVSILAYLTKLLLANINIDSGWFNETTINNSFIFYQFYSGNIFTWISSWISG